MGMKTFVRVIIRSVPGRLERGTQKNNRESLHTRRLKPTLYIQSNGMKENNKEKGSIQNDTHGRPPIPDKAATEEGNVSIAMTKAQ